MKAKYVASLFITSILIWRSLSHAGYFADGDLIEGYSTVTSAGTSTILVKGSPRNIRVTGSTTQDIVLPDATTVKVGKPFIVHNASTGSVAVKDKGLNSLATLSAGEYAKFLSTSAASTNGAWVSQRPSAALGGTASRVAVFDSNGALVSDANVTTTELGFLDNVTSSLCGINQSCTLASKTLASPVLTTPVLTGSRAYAVLVDNGSSTITTIAPDASTTKVLTSGGISALPTWQDPAASPSSNSELSNVGLAASVGSNALTVALKQNDGSTNCSSGAAACKIGVGSSTVQGSYTQRSVTAGLSGTVPSGATLGTVSSVQGSVYVYFADTNGSGTNNKICFAGQVLDEGVLHTSTALSSSASSYSTLYCDAVYSAKIRLLGRVISTQATAGTWATTPTTVAVSYSVPDSEVTHRALICRQASCANGCDGSGCVVAEQDVAWLSGVSRAGTGDITITIAAGYFSARPQCDYDAVGEARDISSTALPPASGSGTIQLIRTVSTSAAREDGYYQIICRGKR